MKPDLDIAIQKHFDAINNRDLNAFKSHLTKTETLYTIVQNGFAFKTPEETIAIHKDWFNDHDWIWEGSVVHKVVGEDMAMVLIKYEYRARAVDKPFSTWLTYVFKLEDNEWRIIHDHNTALDFYAFTKSAGLND
ncbi:MAG: nuclear transport factor 2 family protein [Candidatus Kapabacteria bacterium]|nr:nuclear transport factor 2 family protein [Candidatus Kapabacteria bacterium]